MKIEVMSHASNPCGDGMESKRIVEAMKVAFGSVDIKKVGVSH